MTIFLSWETINRFEKNPFFRSFYVWLWLVPVLAKFFEKLGSSLTLNLAGAEVSFSLQLPFSWQLFFFGGLFIALANILYNLKCPVVTKNFQTIEKYSTELNSDYWLINRYSYVKTK